MCHTTCSPGLRRRYWSKAEKIDWLEDYQQALENELQGVQERITRLREA